MNEQKKALAEFREWLVKTVNYPAVESVDRYLQYLKTKGNNE